MLLVVIATAGCTKPNPAFDQDGGGTRGDTADDTKGDSATSLDASDNGSVEGTGIASSNSSEATASDELGTTDSEGGVVECPATADFDWGIDIIQRNNPAKVDCGIEFEAFGTVLAAEDDVLVIQDCGGCDCSTSFGAYEFHAQGLLPADHFIVGDCAGISIDWSVGGDCRPIGFVAFTGDGSGRAEVVAGQDVETMPTAVGGGVPTAVG